MKLLLSGKQQKYDWLPETFLWLLILFLILAYIVNYYICARPLSYIMYLLLEEYRLTNHLQLLFISLKAI
jgi:hypothetical protein